jgi:transposase
MKYITGTDRSQINLFPVSLDQSIEHDNEVRLIDAFVNSMPIEEYGFKTDFVENGRPGYHPAVLLKLFIYGYMNRIRSSRNLEKECKRNIELMWLLEQLTPDHNTISNFRRDNKKAIKKVFRSTVKLAKNFDLIGCRLLAGDSTKFRAQNSKKNNYNQGKVNRHLEYIDNKLSAYQKELEENDGDKDKQEKIKSEIQKHQQRKEHYKSIEKQIKETGEEQISTSDTESRQMIVRNNITEVVYNVQSTTDEKHNIPIDYKVTNHNDSKAMGNMLQRAKSILHTNSFTALYDKGYHTGSEFKTAHDLGVEVMVAIPGIPSSSQAPDTNYNVSNFIYNQENDCYICPEGTILTTTGTWHQGKNFWFKQYKTKACKQCDKRHLCTRSKKNGKLVSRSEYAPYLEKNKEAISCNKTLYRKRQSIVEHPYGTIKRQWGFNYILTKQGIERAESDVGLMFVAYNLRRIINIIGKDNIMKYLQEAISRVLTFLSQIGMIFSQNKAIKILKKQFINFLSPVYSCLNYPKIDYI